jgi:hypothetical protein
MNTAAAVAASRPVLELELHAYPTIRVDGERVDLPLKGGLALIARLAAEAGRPFARLRGRAAVARCRSRHRPGRGCAA